jgi:hypothetical protein
MKIIIATLLASILFLVGFNLGMNYSSNLWINGLNQIIERGETKWTTHQSQR